MANKKIYVSIEMSILELSESSVLNESLTNPLGTADNDSSWEWGNDAI